MISICTPTRNRPEMFKRFSDSIWNTVTNKDNVEISIYRDNDDKSVYEYSGNYILTTGDRVHPDRNYNICQEAARGPIYVFWPDDFLAVSQGWDVIMQDVFDKSEDKIIFAYPYDKKVGNGHGSIGAIHKNWIDTVGYFFYPEAVRGGDVRINRIAKRLGRSVLLPGTRINNIKLTTDQTHLEYDELIRENKDRLWNSKEMMAEENKAFMALKNFIQTYEKNNLDNYR